MGKDKQYIDSNYLVAYHENVAREIPNRTNYSLTTIDKTLVGAINELAIRVNSVNLMRMKGCKTVSDFNEITEFSNGDIYNITTSGNIKGVLNVEAGDNVMVFVTKSDDGNVTNYTYELFYANFDFDAEEREKERELIENLRERVQALENSQTKEVDSENNDEPEN